MTSPGISSSSNAQGVRIFRYAKFDVDALCRLASRLYGGLICHCDLSQVPFSGSLNWAISISFTNGVVWFLRSPRNDDGGILCSETNSKLLESEAVTLKYIKAHSSIPVPEVFAYKYAMPSTDSAFLTNGRKLFPRERHRNPLYPNEQGPWNSSVAIMVVHVSQRQG